MILYKPLQKIFKNRKEAKQFFGTNKYYKIEKDKKDIVFINNTIATDGKF